MAAPVTHKLVIGRHGEYFIVVGNPDIGYTLLQAVDVDEVGRYRRSHQAVHRATHGIDSEG